MYLGGNLRVVQVAGSQNCNSETSESDLEGKRKRSDIDSCVHAVAKLVSHLAKYKSMVMGAALFKSS